MSSLLYFSYGSNMSTPRMAARVPSARFVCVACLERHKLRFHKIGRDGSAKCDIPASHDPQDRVFGVVYELPAAGKPLLDEFEGLGRGYEEKSVRLTGPAGESMHALSYYATAIDAALKPYHWYKEHVLRGAIEHDLPEYYVLALESVESITDPDPATHTRELSVYGLRAGGSPAR